MNSSAWGGRAKLGDAQKKQRKRKRREELNIEGREHKRKKNPAGWPYRQQKARAAAAKAAGNGRTGAGTPVENDDRLDALLQRLEQDETLSTEERRYVDQGLNRIDELMTELSIELIDNDEEDAQMIRKIYRSCLNVATVKTVSNPFPHNASPCSIINLLSYYGYRVNYMSLSQRYRRG